MSLVISVQAVSCMYPIVRSLASRQLQLTEMAERSKNEGDFLVVDASFKTCNERIVFLLAMKEPFLLPRRRQTRS